MSDAGPIPWQSGGPTYSWLHLAKPGFRDRRIRYQNGESPFPNIPHAAPSSLCLVHPNIKTTNRKADACPCPLWGPHPPPIASATHPRDIWRRLDAVPATSPTRPAPTDTKCGALRRRAADLSRERPSGPFTRVRSLRKLLCDSRSCLIIRYRIYQDGRLEQKTWAGSQPGVQFSRAPQSYKPSLASGFISLILLCLRVAAGTRIT